MLDLRWIVIVVAITSINGSTTQSPMGIVLTDANLIEKLRDELERDENALKLDRKRLEDDKEITTPIHPTDLIELNVGGEMIATTRQTMIKIHQSILFNLFNGQWEHRLSIDYKGNIRFDFDPILFRHLLDQIQTFDTNNSQEFRPPSQPTLVKPFKKMLRKLGLDQLLSSEKNLITFDVGGQSITNRRTTLTAASKLDFDSMVLSPTTINFNNPNDMFLDYDPKLFRHLIDQLRGEFYTNISYLGSTSIAEKLSFNRMLIDLVICHEIIMTSSYVEYLWTFDTISRDLSTTFIGTIANGPRFNSSTITGYSSSLPLSSAANQSVVMDTPFLNLNNRSWTFEAWMYPFTLLNSIDYGIINQCENFDPYKCLHLNIRHQKLYMGFNYDDLAGVTSLTALKWYHITFVFDSISRRQSIYLNGVLDSSREAASVYLGNSGKLIFGLSMVAVTSLDYFDGLINRVYYTNRAKNLTEILDDATLTFYFPFDCGSLHDQGPLRINGSLFGSVKFVVGRKGNALRFGSSIDSYFRVNGLVLLGTSNQSYSMSIWINPTVIKKSSIIHVSTESNGLGSWCVGMLGLSSSGQLIVFSRDNAAVSVAGPILTINSWIHAAITYSTSNGLRLYVDGTLQNSSHSFRYSASGRPIYLFLANPFNESNCIGMSGQFFGALDEFRLYSRELNADDVKELSQLES